MDKYILGLDIGGTKIAAGLLTRQGRQVAREELPTEQEKGFEHSFGQMCRVVDTLLHTPEGDSTPEGDRHGEIEGIGACAPGPMDYQRGILFNPPNLAGWVDLPLRGLLEDRYGLPVKVDNDANAAGLAEALWGAGAGYDSVFYATVSTGIGTGIILDRKILHGKNGMAAEGGHLTIQYQDERVRCNCGNVGCIEAYASGTSAARRAREKLRGLAPPPALLMELTGGAPDRVTMREIAEAARRGDPFSREIIRETGTLLGVWLGSVVSLLDPDVIVLGGGMTQIGDPLFEPIRQELPRRTINPFASDTPVVRAHFGTDVGIYGGAALFLSGK